MIIEKLKISGFRNLEEKELTFCSGSNLVHGVNGAGKTSILEAIFLLAFSKSFLNRKKAEIVRQGSSGFAIHLTITGPAGTNRVSAHYQLNQGYSVRLNQKSTHIFEVNHYLYPVFFSSADYHLYIENMPHTRKMLDRFIFGVDSLYIKDLLSYNSVLKQKNHLLKNNGSRAELKSWNKIISELSEKIIGKKMTFINQLNTEIGKHFDRNLFLVYHPSLTGEKGISHPEIYRQLETLEPLEQRARCCIKGPHRDQLEIVLNQKHLKMYSSGEKKIHLLMIYIAFLRLYFQKKQEYPVFLIDDFDIAMDSRNISRLMTSYPQMQVIATSVNHYHDFSSLIHLVNN